MQTNLSFIQNDLEVVVQLLWRVFVFCEQCLNFAFVFFEVTIGYIF